MALTLFLVTINSIVQAGLGDSIVVKVLAYGITNLVDSDFLIKTDYALQLLKNGRILLKPLMVTLKSPIQWIINRALTSLLIIKAVIVTAEGDRKVEWNADRTVFEEEKF